MCYARKRVGDLSVRRGNEEYLLVPASELDLFRDEPHFLAIDHYS